MVKFLFFFFLTLILQYDLQAQFYSLGHHQMVDPILTTINQYHKLKSVDVKENDSWDKANSNSFSVVLFYGDSPRHEVVYQSDNWGNINYIGVSSSLSDILNSVVFPRMRFEMECKKINTFLDGKEKIRSLLSLLVAILNESEL